MLFANHDVKFVEDLSFQLQEDSEKKEKGVVEIFVLIIKKHVYIGRGTLIRDRCLGEKGIQNFKGRLLPHCRPVLGGRLDIECEGRSMRAAVIYATYGHWTQSLLNADISLAYHYQPKLDIDPDDERAGWVGDPLAKQVLFMNFPNIGFRPPSADDEAYDLIVGSPPCVGFSRANPRARSDHPLNRHTFNFFKWVALNGPKHFLMEMVPGLLKSQDPDKGLGIFNQCLKLIMDDYRWDYEVMNAADYGAAQTRERLYVWGNRRDQEPMESPLASLPKKPSTPIQIVLTKEILDLAEQCVADGKSRLSLLGKNGQPIAGAWGSLRPDKRENRALKMDGLMFTITGTSVRDCLIPIQKSSITEADQNRLLTVLELKLLMGFPFSYSLPGKLHAGVKSKIIASGVDIRFASYLLKHIRKVVEID